VGINRIFLGPYNAKVFGEKIKEKQDKVFDVNLQEEHEKLVQLVSKLEKKWNTEKLCRKYNLKTKYNTSSNQ
jgi:hypothetical protein